LVEVENSENSRVVGIVSYVDVLRAVRRTLP
jgi:hypothetical protein